MRRTKGAIYLMLLPWAVLVRRQLYNLMVCTSPKGSASLCMPQLEGFRGALPTCETVQVCVWVEVFNLLELDATAANDVLNGLIAFDSIGPVPARLHAVQYGSVLR